MQDIGIRGTEDAPTPFTTAFERTILGGRLRGVDDIYARIEIAQREFRERASRHDSPVQCPSGCGVCCADFMPDVLPLEAQRLALHLLTENQESLAILSSPEGTRAACPFWDPDKPGANCAVYPARPLICRLFGFSAVLGKTGEPEFSLCRHMAPYSFTTDRILKSGDLDERLGGIPPIMTKYAAELVALDPQESGDRRLLHEALPDALDRVSLILRLTQGLRDGKPEPDQPEPDTPAPAPRAA